MYEKYDGGMIYLDDDSSLNIVGCSRVLIKFLDGGVKGISGVLHISGVLQNVFATPEHSCGEHRASVMYCNPLFVEYYIEFSLECGVFLLEDFFP